MTKQNNRRQYLNTIRWYKTVISVVFPLQRDCWELSPFTRNIRRKWTTPLEKRRLRQISAYNVSTAKNSIMMIGNRLRAFQRAIDGVRSLPLSPQRVAQKPIFQFFWIKSNFNRIKSATMFRCVKTSSCKVVEQSISCEITEKYKTESVSFHWLKLTYPVVARCHDTAQCCRMTSCLK